MKKSIFIVTIVLATFALQNCNTAKKSATTSPVANPTFTYSRDILPIVNMHCSPCHTGPTSKEVHLNQYDVAVKEVNDMIHMTSLSPDSPKFMPFKHKKPALSTEQIDMLKKWRDEGTPQ